MKKSAVLSDCRQYRYELWRVWDESKPYTVFIGLNPSTADETEDDPTIRRCINFAKSWGYGGLCMVNLFAFRATQPEDMKRASDPIGSQNDSTLLRLAENAGVIVAAWGNDGVFMERSSKVRTMLPTISALKVNKSGEPAHPLYLKSSLTPVAFVD
ncbi:DUF1643 domain-containing protein [Shewanella woodyi]|uniref:DUF1643 domain-containing protein n=1 Tax=Shewanella woodyi (strain ATCC 51908 / MS32) TaxID=392500 RepID=B1KKL7_SHEWM|nr:DUF1643 domain-containing protein [Shewanella woodyi]ACA87234.1 protein of unknown function DUF1643 [Shewanella woodyi ATCC 51908]